MNDKLHHTIPEFEPANAASNELWIEMGANYHAYAIVDNSSKAVKALSFSPSVLFSDIEGSLLQTHFSKTKISLQTQKFTFIPTVLFDKNNLAVYKQYLQPDDTEDVFTTVIQKGEITVIYALPKLTLDKLSKHFPDAKIYPQLASFCEGVNYAFSQISFPQLHINFRPGFIELIIFNKNEFKFYNIFEYQNKEEVMYFLLLAVQQNHLKPASLLVKVCGDVDTKSEIYQSISAQFGRTEVTDLDSLPLTYQGLGYPALPRFFSLLSLNLCE